MLLETRYGNAAVKVCGMADGKRYYPEYDSVAAISRAQGLPFGEVYRIIATLAAEENR